MLSACCVAASFLYAQEPGDPMQGMQAPPAKPFNEDMKKKASYSVGFNIGSDIARNLSGAPLKLSMEDFRKGLGDALEAKAATITPEEMKEALASLQGEMVRLQEVAQKEAAGKNKEFLDKNEKEAGIKKSPKGVQYKVLKEGTGAQPKLTDTVVVHYTGTLLDGKEFDSSHKRGQPATFPINQVIVGWQDIVPLMKEGSKWKIWIPSDLAYGEAGSPPTIPPNSILVFELELISVPKEEKK